MHGGRARSALLAEDLSLSAVTQEAEQLLSIIERDEPNRLPLPTPVYAVADALHISRHTVHRASSTRL